MLPSFLKEESLSMIPGQSFRRRGLSPPSRIFTVRRKSTPVEWRNRGNEWILLECGKQNVYAAYDRSFRGSSTVERPAVNRRGVGSNPTGLATLLIVELPVSS